MEGRATADTVRLLSNKKWYIYVLKLVNERIYTGCTSDLDERITRHKNGYVDSTKWHLPITLIFYAVFYDKYKAFKFEKYLKSGSGRAFINRHLL